MRRRSSSLIAMTREALLLATLGVLTLSFVQSDSTPSEPSCVRSTTDAGSGSRHVRREVRAHRRDPRHPRRPPPLPRVSLARGSRHRGRPDRVDRGRHNPSGADRGRRGPRRALAPDHGHARQPHHAREESRWEGHGVDGEPRAHVRAHGRHAVRQQRRDPTHGTQRTRRHEGTGRRKHAPCRLD